MCDFKIFTSSGFHSCMTTILITYSGIYNQVYTSGFNTINQIYKITIIHTCLAVISIPLAKIHIKTHSELLHKLYINKSQIYQALSTFCLVPISSVNIRFNFHTAIPIALFSIAHRTSSRHHNSSISSCY